VRSHLTAAEYIDALEGKLGPERQRHLTSCPRCRGEISALRASADDIEDVVVPEPSPLFWTHQASRIAAAIAVESVPARRAMLPRLAWAGALAAGVIAVAIMFAPDRVPSSGPLAPAVTEVARVPLALADPDDERAWNLLMAIGSELDEASAVDALSPASATVDAAVRDLNPEERATLAALLRAELKGPRS